MRLTICLLTTLALLSGCSTSKTEGRATAILDAAMPEAEAHAKALAGNDLPAARRSGIRLLAVLKEWR